MASPAGRVAVAVAAVLAASACAGIPAGGGVHVGRVMPAPGGLGEQVDVRVLPAPPVRGMSPLDLVRGFLRSMVDSDGRYEVSRAYLTSHAATTWDPSAGVTTYDDSGLRTVVDHPVPGGHEVAFEAPRVGFINARGDYTPAAGTTRFSFGLQKRSGQWRIDRLPAGLLLSTLDTVPAYRLVDIYYLNPAGTALAPEQVLLRPSARGVTTALVRLLVEGPGSWISPAVHSAFPSGTGLIGNVPVDPSGVADVNLSAAVRQASAASLQALSAQIVWTLRQVDTVTGVRLFADGSPLAVPGAPAVQPISSWAQFNPAAVPKVERAVYDKAGRLLTVPAGGLRGLASAGRLTSPALSGDGRLVAGVRGSGNRVGLWVGKVGAAPVRRVLAKALSPPTFDPSGDVFTVAGTVDSHRIVEVTTSGAVRTVPADAALLDHEVQALRLSRDGTRFAAVLGPLGGARLAVGRVTVTHDGLRFDGVHDVLPGYDDIRGVAWSGADELVVTAGAAAGGRQVVSVDCSGYSARSIATDGVAGDPVDVAAAPGSPLLVAADGDVWAQSAGSWQHVGAGGDPAYAD